ncbi:MAG: tRNA (uridine(34)/cytosine(34)/5-carboxymethylaminomethyluridine(34)-2'-O)-methyltransferase TrmL [Thiotrichaceae bacterium]
MFHCVLYQPEIPPNTGNIIRLCANTNIALHLIHPLGFQLDDKRMKRAGLDYHEWARVQQHDSFEDFRVNVPITRLYAVSTKGTQNYAEIDYHAGDAFVFGPETRGLPASILAQFPAAQIIRIPMHATSRSLNLSNAAAIILYEAWRQQGFALE